MAGASDFGGGFTRDMAPGSRTGEVLEGIRILLESVADLENPGEYAQAYARLPRFRQVKADTLMFGRDKCLSVGAWLLLGRAFMLEGYCLDDYRIGYSQCGKPFVMDCPLHFSIAHSGEYAMCAVSQAGEIGCDIQRIDAYDGDLARVCMKPCEISRIEASSCFDERALRFCRHWVAKESYMKALGCGLAKDPASFAVGLRDAWESDAGCKLKWSAPGDVLVFDGDQAERACVFGVHAPQGYCAAVCALGCGDAMA